MKKTEEQSLASVFVSFWVNLFRKWHCACGCLSASHGNLTALGNTFYEEKTVDSVYTYMCVVFISIQHAALFNL